MTNRKADEYQVGGDHYRKMAHQPQHLTRSYGLGGFEHSAIKYVSRWRNKGGIDDLRKALHFCEMLIENENRFIQIGQPKGFDLPLTSNEYCSDNDLGDLETIVVMCLCRWDRLLNPHYLKQAREAVLELIHVERMREKADSD